MLQLITACRVVANAQILYARQIRHLTVRANHNQQSRFGVYRDGHPCFEKHVRPALPPPAIMHLLDRPRQMLLFPPFCLTRTEGRETLDREVEEEIGGGATMNNISGEDYRQMLVAYGPPGVGKSTLSREVALATGATLLDDDTIIKKKASRLSKYLHASFKNAEYSQLTLFQMEALDFRFTYAHRHIGPCVVDESIFSTLAYSRALLRLGMMTEDAYQTFYRLFLRYKSIHAGGLTIFSVTCPMDEQMRRIAHRGRSVEKLYTVDYVQALRESFAETWNDLPGERIEIDNSSRDVKVALQTLVDKWRPTSTS